MACKRRIVRQWSSGGSPPRAITTRPGSRSARWGSGSASPTAVANSNAHGVGGVLISIIAWIAIAVVNVAYALRR
jgi:hypothetical protein